jgi:hypothetical protein
MKDDDEIKRLREQLEAAGRAGYPADVLARAAERLHEIIDARWAACECCAGSRFDPDCTCTCHRCNRLRCVRTMERQ